MSVGDSKGARERVIEPLRSLADLGYLRRLDAEFALYMAELDPAADPALPFAAAMLCRAEGQGHTCLAVAELANPDPSQEAEHREAEMIISRLRSTLPKSLPEWVAALARSAPILHAEQAPDQGQPLVLDDREGRPRLYLRRYWRDERSLAEALMQRCSLREPVDEPRARALIDLLFEGSEGTVDSGTDRPTDWQRIACAIALRSRCTIITGGPGTGKTYTAARLLALCLGMSEDPIGVSIALAAPTGKAAARLRQSIEGALHTLRMRIGERIDLKALDAAAIKTGTLHALLGSRPDSRRFQHNSHRPLDLDLVLVDEASMVDLAMMSALLNALPKSSRLILLGDKDQLASVEPGAVLGDLCAQGGAERYDEDTARYLAVTTGQCVAGHEAAPDGSAPTAGGRSASPALAALGQQTVILRKSERFSGPIGELARRVNDGEDPAETARLLRSDASGTLWYLAEDDLDQVIDIAVRGRSGAAACYRDYLALIQSTQLAGSSDQRDEQIRGILRAFERFRVLCAVRDGAWGTIGLNRQIEARLSREGLIQPQGLWYVGRPVMVTRNEPRLGLSNGDVGVTLPAGDDSAKLRVYFLNGIRVHSVSVNRLSHVETAFAMTVHKSQGSEFDHTLLALAAYAGRVLTRELLYTGITRARSAFSLAAANGGLLQAAIQRKTRRESGLRDALDQSGRRVLA